MHSLKRSVANINPQIYQQQKSLRSGTLPSTKASVSLVHDYKGSGVPILYAADNFIIQRSISNISLIGAQSIIGRAVVVYAYPDDLGKSKLHFHTYHVQLFQLRFCTLLGIKELLQDNAAEGLNTVS
ncbi:copper/zinc-superoxide dismutase [Tanacetum coccineum]